jgi:error-prone DNA polymerase
MLTAEREATHRYAAQSGAAAAAGAGAAAAARTGRRVLVHASGFRQSPYADIKPAGAGPGDGRGVPAAGELLPPRKLWHSSPGSSGH